MATQWTGQPRIKGSSESMRMFLLTFSMIGLQFAWGTEMTYCTPYLLSLGMSKSRMSLVWIAGPLSGLVVQPIVGMKSDKSRSRHGRRRPYMVGGTVAVAICYLILGWTQEIVAFFVNEAELQRECAILLAVGNIYVLDFMINISQSACKALVVDTLPIQKQQLGAAWGSRMSGFGHLLVYAIGALDLNSVLGNFLGDTQFKKVCVIAAIGMTASQGVSIWAVQERVLVADGKIETKDDDNISSILSQIYTTFMHVPERIQAICWVQFWSWIGWFPILFYGSTWVGEIYLRYDAPEMAKSKDALNEVGRHGSMALIVFSIVGTISSVVIPWMVQSPDDNEKVGYTARPPQGLESFLEKTKWRKPSLLTAWACGLVLFAASMLFAPMVQSARFATFLLAFCGIPNAMSALAPGTFLGVEINRMSSNVPPSHSRTTSAGRFSDDSIEMGRAGSPPRTLHLRHDSTSSVSSSSTGELSGIYLGILNIYTTLPQFVGTAISWVVFSILEPGKSPELAKEGHPDEHHPKNGYSAIGVCLFIGALSSIVAAWSTRRLRGAY